jgi:hypothetical protein
MTTSDIGYVRERELDLVIPTLTEVQYYNGESRILADALYIVLDSYFYDSLF